MTRSEFVKVLATANGLPVSEARHIVDLVLDGFVSVLVGGDKLVLTGFGTFIVKPKRTKQGKTVKLIPSAQLKDAVSCLDNQGI